MQIVMGWGAEPNQTKPDQAKPAHVYGKALLLSTYKGSHGQRDNKALGVVPCGSGTGQDRDSPDVYLRLGGYGTASCH